MAAYERQHHPTVSSVQTPEWSPLLRSFRADTNSNGTQGVGRQGSLTLGWTPVPLQGTSSNTSIYCTTLRTKLMMWCASELHPSVKTAIQNGAAMTPCLVAWLRCRIQSMHHATRWTSG
jgi:hypothetical protein